MDGDLCTVLDHPSIFNTTLSLALAVGIVGSYVPQHLRIIIRRSSRGLSPWFLLLGVTSGTCSLTNVLLLSSDVLQCCSKLSAGKCMAASLGVIQIGLQFTMFAIILLLYIQFFPRDPLLDADRERARRVAVLCGVHFCFTFLIAFVIYKFKSGAVALYAGFLGIEATLLAASQYVPQIYTTYSLKRAESLSIHTLAMQAPGGYLWALTLALREGTGWSSWLPYLLAATLQSILLILCIKYERSAGHLLGSSLAELSSSVVQELEEEPFGVSIFEEETDPALLIQDQHDYDAERSFHSSKAGPRFG
ncbi:hypothetical protein BZA70DRAFT_274454 [Myxozyma melibiosi]|uniref:PQ loop repeat protein n=1 Tax=Myxozyma melibiosi TaxID=54550 RepID=A0ABR1F9K9_9ASCO